MKPMHMFSAAALYFGLSWATYTGHISPPKVSGLGGGS